MVPPYLNSKDDDASWEILAKDQGLCDFCSAIDFGKLSNEHPYFIFTGNEHVSSLGRRFQNRPSNSCKLCELLWLQKEHMVCAAREGWTYPGDTHSLWAFRFFTKGHGCHALRDRQKIPRNLGPEADFFNLVVIPDHWNIQDVKSVGIAPDRSRKIFKDDSYIPSLAFFRATDAERLFCKPRVLPTAFLPQTALQWLHRCKTYHETCNAPSNTRAEVSLIDCHTLKLISAGTDLHYVALSYVWGDARPTPLVHGFGVPKDTSLVIRDAIKVTKALGFHYLWVDQYCVDQVDPIRQARQITQMDLIYSQAQMTIAAAAGDSALYGLPGVSSCPRERFQTAVQIENNRIIDLGPDGQADVSRSKWSTRGWTFQEAWLSKRLLCFTDKQCYFECKAIACSESLELPEQVWQMPDIAIPRLFRHLSFGPYFHSKESTLLTGPWSRVELVWYMIFSYCERRLTFDHDALNAIIGALHRAVEVQRVTDPAIESFKFTAIRGIPLLIGSYCNQPLLQPTLITGLSWLHAGWVEATMDGANVVNMPRRREKLPSWSFLGWEGAIELAWNYIGHITFDAAINDVRVAVLDETHNGRRHDIEDIDIHSCAQSLHFTALQIPNSWLTYVADPADTYDWLLCGCGISIGLSEATTPAALLHDLAQDNFRLCLIGYSHEDRKALIWILRKTNAVWIRVGLFFLRRPNLEEYTEDSAMTSFSDHSVHDHLMLLIGMSDSIHWEIV